MSELTPATLVSMNKTVGESGRLVKPDILDSAFASLDYYDDPYEKVASVVRSVMQGHPFVDGNKRTGIVFMFAAAYVYRIPVPEKSDDVVVAFATESVVERWSVTKIANWLRT